MKRNQKLITILTVVIIAFLLILLVISSKGSLKGKESNDNQYRISDYEVELPDTIVTKNDKLTKGHCLDDICVKDVVIYDANGEGRIEYTIVNNGSEKATDILKLNFGDSFTYVAFTDLSSNNSVRSKTIYKVGNYKNIEDFKIERLTEEELGKIVRD